MRASGISIVRTGLATAVGLSSPTSCAAFRAKLTNPSVTRFMGNGGQWIGAHQVPLQKAWQGRARLAELAAMAIEEALQDWPSERDYTLPLLLCVAEPDRPGRLQGLDDQLFTEIQELTHRRFAKSSAIINHGRVSVATALLKARSLIESGVPRVLIAAVDSLLHGASLSHYLREGRLLGPHNPDGFVPGEGAGALLIGPETEQAALVCCGVGFANETANIGSGLPLRADGLTAAVRTALAEAHCEMHDMDYRITDASGEQYYFKEAALALTRCLRQRKADFEIWHPAECTGEAGALVGVSILAWADAAGRKGYAKGNAVLAHLSNDDGRRAALALHFKAA